jgi:hypothetical protein
MRPIWLALSGIALLATAVLAVGLAGAAGPDSKPGKAPPPDWVRIRHAQFPLSFELPDGSSVRRLGVFSLAAARSRERRPIEVDVYGIRDLPHRLAAVQVSFFWVTPEYQGVTRESLGALEDGVGDPEQVEAFLRQAFYSRMKIELRDHGRTFVDGHSARSMGAARSVAAGTRDERVIEGRIVVVPVPDEACLVVIARFDPEATDEERDVMLPHLLESLSIGDETGGSMRARPPADADDRGRG